MTIINITCRLIHWLVGNYAVLADQVVLTEEFCKTKWPHIVKVFGPTGAGKDSTATAVTVNLRKGLMESSEEELEKLHSKLWLFDLNNLLLYIEDNYQDYLSSSQLFKKSKYLEDLPKNCCFLKKRIHDKIDTHYFIETFINFGKNKVDIESEFLFSDGLSNKHYLALLYEYICVYVRLNYMPNYLLANQPMIEDRDTNLMAKKFSYDYIKSISRPSYQITGKGGMIQQYKEKVKWPFVDKIILYETEAGTFYNNKNQSLIKNLLADGIRETKAYNRHLFSEFFYWIIVDQTADRTVKVLREQEHAYVCVIDRTIVPGGKKRIFFWNIMKKIKNLFVKDVFKKNEKLKDKKETDLPKLQELFEITHNSKYEKKLNKLMNQQPLAEKLKSINKQKKIDLLNQKIERALNDGYIQVELSISDGSYLPKDMPVFTVEDLINKNKKLFRQCYKTVLTFPINYSYGKYDTHFLSTIAKLRSSESEISISQVENWDKSLSLSKKDVLDMGYESIYHAFGITDEDVTAAKWNKKEIAPSKK